MILVVEGPDRCGKDTLIKQVRNSIMVSPYVVTIHSIAPPKSVPNKEAWAMYHYEFVLTEAAKLNSNGDDVIFNRSHLGEDVYGPLYRKTNGDFIYALERNFLPLDSTYLVLLTDDPLEIAKREDGDSIEQDLYSLERTVERFDYAYESSNIANKLRYHISDDGGFDNLFPIVEGFLEHAYN